MIDVTLLGTAALMPTPDRALTAAALTVNGRVLLIDCGEGTQTSLRRWGVSPMRVDLIALTHYHGDHIFGLPGLLQTMGVQARTAPLYIVGPGDVAVELAPVLQLAGPQPYGIRLLTLPEEGVAPASLLPGWPTEARLTAFPTVHRVISQGYAFALDRAPKFLPEKAKALGVPVSLWSVLQRGEAVTLEGRVVRPEEVLGPSRPGLKVVMSGDTTDCPSLEAAARDADLLISEATYGEDDQADLARAHGHMNFAQAAALAARAGVKRLWLAHYSQMVEDPAARLANAQTFYPEAVCGEDGLHIQLRFPDA